MSRRGDYSYTLTEDTILDVLYYVRAEAVRNRRWTVKCHADALITARGYDPSDSYVPKKHNRLFKRGELRLLVIGILRDEPLTGPAVVERVVARRRDLDYDDAYKRTYACLASMNKKGEVEHENGVYCLCSMAARSQS